MNLKDVLTQYNIDFKTTNNPAEVALRCTSGLHVDNTPSLMYNIERDIFNCWSCGFKGSKRKFLRSIGINTDIPFDSKQPFKLAKLKGKITDLINQNSLKIPDDARFIQTSFRNISADTINKFQAFYTEQYGLLDYICFPVYQFGKLRFFEGRNKYNESNKPKYYRRPINSRSQDILFPLDMIKDKSRLIMVEGLFDMLNMWDKGYENTVCIFGVNNLTKAKLDILDKVGTTYVEVMFDGDMAGTSGATRAVEYLDKHFIQTKIITLPENTDPGNLDQNQLAILLPKDRFK